MKTLEEIEKDFGEDTLKDCVIGLSLKFGFGIDQDDDRAYIISKKLEFGMPRCKLRLVFWGYNENEDKLSFQTMGGRSLLVSCEDIYDYELYYKL